MFRGVCLCVCLCGIIVCVGGRKRVLCWVHVGRGVLHCCAGTGEDCVVLCCAGDGRAVLSISGKGIVLC